MNVCKIDYNVLPDRKYTSGYFESDWVVPIYSVDEVEYVFWRFWDKLRNSIQ